MDSGIKVFIQNSYTNDKADLLIEIFDLLEDAQVEDYEILFLGIIMEYDNKDPNDVTSEFEQLALAFLMKITQEHGITVSEEIPLYVLSKLCDGILGIQYYLGVDDILTATGSTKPAEEKFCQILEFVNGLDEQISITYVEEVDPSLIVNIEKMFAEKDYIDIDTLEDDARNYRIIRKLRELTKFLNSENYIATRLIMAGVLVGAKFEEYITYIDHKLDDMDNVQIAKELILLLSMSRDGYESISQTYSSQSSKLFTELEKTTKIFSLINGMLVEFERYVLKKSSILTNQLPKG
jgi:hypothetical protein